MTSITIPLDHVTEARLRAIAEEMDRDIWDLVASVVTETALDYFRHRPEADPARQMRRVSPLIELQQAEGTWQ